MHDGARVQSRGRQDASDCQRGAARGGREGGTHHLPRGHAHRLDRELAAAHVEEVLEAGSEEIDDEDVVQAFLTELIYLQNTGCGIVQL